MDETIKRDQNNVTVGAGITLGDETISMLRVDPTTKRALILITEDEGTDKNTSAVASRDANHRPVLMGWDEENQTVQEILVDSHGNLLIQA